MTHFDGETYEPVQDQKRLASALERTYNVLSDGKWHTLKELSQVTGASEAGVSARVRDLRKSKFRAKFPNEKVESERLEGGLWQYRMIL